MREVSASHHQPGRPPPRGPSFGGKRSARYDEPSILAFEGAAFVANLSAHPQSVSRAADVDLGDIQYAVDAWNRVRKTFDCERLSAWLTASAATSRICS